MIKVSVIVPVYNTEQYLTKCLNSLTQQTLKDIEIICINDASTDGSLKILQEYALRDNRIKIIDFKQNKGAGAARNTGIDTATGEYIGFVDSDDYPETKDFYEKLYDKAKETEADIVKGAYKNSDTDFIDKSINQKVKEDKNNFCSTYCCAIFNANLVRNNGIKFPLLRDMEDPVFAFTCALKANKVEVVDDLNLIITQRPSSITKFPLTLKQVKEKTKALKSLYKLDSKCKYPYVLAYWIVTVILDSIRNTNFEITQFVLYNVSKIYKRVKNKNGLNIEISKIDSTIEKFLTETEINYFFDKIKLKKQIDKHQIISFDVFDTLLLRPFIEPIDVFRYLGKVFDNPQYSINRVFSENKARILNNIRNKNSEDITLDAIYNKMNPEFKVLQESEINFEKQILTYNREILEIYNYALNKGKTIIATSDMYLPKDILSIILKEKGYNDIEKIYVSSDIGKCKGSGNLYQYIIDDLKINKSDILHIGDNYISDFKKPKELGIDAFWYPKVTERYFHTPQNFYHYSYYEKSSNKALLSFIFGMQILNRQNNCDNCDYWFSFGYKYGGPLIISFLSNINKIAKIRKLTDLFFVARDSYMLYKIYNIIKTDDMPKGHYIYASRKLKKLCIKSKENNEYSDYSASEYLKYATNIHTSGKKIGIIDTCAGAFSAQELIETYFKNIDFIGIYLANHINFKYNYINLSGCSNTEPKELGFKWDIIEFLLASFEPPIENIKDLKPVYREHLTKEDIDKNKAYERVAAGELQFFNDYSKLFKNYDTILNVKDIFKYIAALWENMNGNDYRMLNSIKNPIDADQKEYLSLTETFRMNKNRAIKALLSIV